jgi:PadR family transcriptional regulator, regulatory protein PadR
LTGAQYTLVDKLGEQDQTRFRTSLKKPQKEQLGQTHRFAAGHPGPADSEDPSLEPAHGWGIAQRIRQVSKDVLLVNQGALYPVLHRLEQNGWIKAEWGESENNRRAKYYSLTRAGKKYMQQEEANWQRLSAAIGLVLKIG